MRLIATFNPPDNGYTYAAKVYRDAEFNQYVVKLFCWSQHQTEADYFTNDKDDAMSTAQDMVKRANRATPNPTLAAPDNGDDEVIPCFLGTDGVWRTAYAVVGVTS